MQNYIPSQGSNNLPVLTSSQNGGKSEREMLYTLLFDMRREINELRTKVNDLMGVHDAQAQDTALQPYHQQPEMLHSGGTIHIQAPSHIQVQQPIPVHEVEYVDETLSLEDVQKKTIISALDRNHGRRCDAARELGISERTLYRKIKEYGIE